MRPPDRALIPPPRRSSRTGRLSSTGRSLKGICRNKVILYACGASNALFAVFPVLLGWNFQHRSSLAPGVRALLQAFNLGGLLMIVFLAAAFLACQADLRTRLGRATILLGALTYLVRALDEFVLFPRVGWAVVILCAITGLLHLAALRAARNAA